MVYFNVGTGAGTRIPIHEFFQGTIRPHTLVLIQKY